MSEYSGYTLDKIWKLTLTQIKMLTDTASERKVEDLRRLFNGFRVAQHGNGNDFVEYLNSLKPKKPKKPVRPKLTKSS